MTTRVKSYKEFLASVEDSESSLSVVVLSASWCSSCQDFKPVFDEVAKSPEFRDRVSFFHVEVDDCKELTQILGVKTVPSVGFFSGHTLKDVHVGANEQKFREKLRHFLHD